MIDGIEDFDDLTGKQVTNLRLDCLFLKKAYEIALQRMNEYTWTQCIFMAIKELEDCGIRYVITDKPVRLINQSFRVNEKLQAGFAKSRKNRRYLRCIPRLEI